MKKITMMIVTLSLALAVLGCSKPADSPQASASPAATQNADHGDHDGHDHAAHSGDKVEVSAEGSKFDPAVAVDKMPDGAWACVMDGTVHYAQSEEGEGKCKTCKMKLVKQGAADADSGE